MCFYFIAGNIDPHRWQEKREGKKSIQIPPVSGFFSRRGVNPRAASGGGAWEDASPLFMLFQKGSQHYYGFLNGYFVILELFNVIFVKF